MNDGLPSLAGRRLLITGVLNAQSIAFHTARRAQQAGAELVLTGFGRGRRHTERAAQRLDPVPPVLELDVNRAEDLDALARELDTRWGGLDGVLHAIAFAPEDALSDFLTTAPESAEIAFRTSAFSLKALCASLQELLTPGASVVAMDFGSPVGWHAYHWMAVAKASLREVARYLARDLGPRGVRVNLVSSGPLRTIAAQDLVGFDGLAAAWTEHAPLGWDQLDPEPVADAVIFLLSRLARAISGEIVHVDGGMHALGGVPLPAPREEVLRDVA